MATKTFCDRCKKEMFVSITKRPTVFAQILGGEREGIWQLCENCSLALRDWIERNA